MFGDPNTQRQIACSTLDWRDNDISITKYNWRKVRIMDSQVGPPDKRSLFGSFSVGNLRSYGERAEKVVL
jgi:hypothetical protein